MLSKQRENPILDSLYITLVLIALMFLSDLIVCYSTHLQANSTILLCLNVGTKIVTYILLILLFKINIKNIILKKVNIKLILLYILLGICYIFFEAFILSPFTSKVPNISLYQIFSNRIGLYNMNVSASRVFIFTYTVIIAPICEELIFRGFILDKLLNCFKKPYMAVIISSLLFAVFHLSFAAGINAFVFGIFSSYMYTKHKNIRYNIAFHRTINTITFLVILLH